MAKTLTLAAFLVCVSCDSSTVVVASSTTVPASPSQSPLAPSPSASHQPPSSSTPLSSSASQPMMTTVFPEPSPTPAPPLIPGNDYYLYRQDGSVCVRLEAGIETSVTYNSVNGGTRKALLVVSGNATVDNSTSTCDETSAQLGLTWSYNNRDFYYLTFAFTATNTSWSEDSVTFKYALTDQNMFPNYTRNASEGVAVFDSSLLESRQNSNNQSFLCNATRTFSTRDTNTSNTTTATLTLENLRVQAFYFSNPSTGHFDGAFDCAADQSTNKIVPIVVGAALAGLVIVVLIAYLIGRFRNRKQSSYEALS